MDGMYEILAKGGVGLVAAYLIVKWLAGAVRLLFDKFDERAREMMAHCDRERRELTARVEKLEDQRGALLNGAYEALVVSARAIERLSTETGSFQVPRTAEGPEGEGR